MTQIELPASIRAYVNEAARRDDRTGASGFNALYRAGGGPACREAALKKAEAALALPGQENGAALLFAFDETGDSRFLQAAESAAAFSAPVQWEALPFLTTYDMRLGGKKNAGWIVKQFRASDAPAAPGAFLAALIDAVDAMDEQLYEHYRALVDQFRSLVFARYRDCDKADLPALYALLKAARLGVLDGEKYQLPAIEALARLPFSPDQAEAYLLALSERVRIKL